MEDNEPPDINTSNNTSSENISLSYSNAISNNQQTFPTKQQTIVFSSLNNVKIEEYLFATGLEFYRRISCVLLEFQTIILSTISQENKSSIISSINKEVLSR